MRWIILLSWGKKIFLNALIPPTHIATFLCQINHTLTAKIFQMFVESVIESFLVWKAWLINGLINAWLNPNLESRDEAEGTPNSSLLRYLHPGIAANQSLILSFTNLEAFSCAVCVERRRVTIATNSGCAHHRKIYSISDTVSECSPYAFVKEAY